MSGTEEWLRYIETKAVMQKYQATGYASPTGSFNQEEQKES